ncbi:GDSL esterase/lipase [Zea mays]|uniref:GDSL esterase/lipase n=1 Tax=Zea mays TaxID=4577 RepID=A0A3L6FQZ5_MAIZE|nr:GDSL esterase/lipase [Zea mays]
MKRLLFAAVCALLVLFNAGRVECRRHGDSGDSARQYKLFVFGDDYADTGNYPLADLSKTTRAWYYPYGSNDKDHGMSASGRFSNGLVLPDFIARILGREESPPAESKREQDGVDPFGMNFAVGGAGVVEGTREAPKLGTQVDRFRRLMIASVHNAYLEEKVFKDAAVLNLDLNTMFRRLTSGSGSSQSSKRFNKHRLEPCCEVFDRTDYCGRMDDGAAAYSLCSAPDKYFYWDEINPTHAGWKAVVNELEESIKNFL